MSALQEYDFELLTQEAVVAPLVANKNSEFASLPPVEDHVEEDDINDLPLSSLLRKPTPLPPATVTPVVTRSMKKTKKKHGCPKKGDTRALDGGGKKKAATAVANGGRGKPASKKKPSAPIELNHVRAAHPLQDGSNELPYNLCVLGGGVEPFNLEAMARKKGVASLSNEQNEMMLTATSQSGAYVRRRAKNKANFMDLLRLAKLTRSIICTRS